MILININVNIEMGNFVMKFHHNKIPCMFCELTDIQQFSKTLPLISKLNFTISTATGHKQAYNVQIIM